MDLMTALKKFQAMYDDVMWDGNGNYLEISDVMNDLRGHEDEYPGEYTITQGCIYKLDHRDQFDPAVPIYLSYDKNA